MLTLELSVLVLENPNDAYTTLSRNLIGCSTLRQENLQADWLIVQNNEKATLNINMPYWLAVLLIECWTANQYKTECCISLIENFQYGRQGDNRGVLMSIRQCIFWKSHTHSVKDSISYNFD